MEAEQNRVIVAEGACDGHTVHVTRVHHQDFPDIHAEGETAMEHADPNRIIVTESRCRACNARTFLVHHQTFPEMRVEAMSPDQAARRLAHGMESALGMVSDPQNREEVRLAIDDARAFAQREVCARSGSDAHGHHQS